MRPILKVLLLSATTLFLAGFCASKDHNPVEVVQDFDVNKYLGTWYEIARLDIKWERNIERVTAQYSLRDDGKVKVVNRGYDTLKSKWKESTGKARFAGSRNEGRLEVSFFGPFYSEYNVVALDKDYKYALVLGESPEYMWILSREKTIPQKIKDAYLEKARSLGVATGNLVWVSQE